MVRYVLALALGGCLWLAPTANADDPVAGNWKLSYANSPTSEMIHSIIKLEKKEGQWEATMVAANPRIGNWETDKVFVNGNLLHINVKGPSGDFVFEGVMGKDGKKLLGSYGNDRFIFPATIIWTEDDQIDANAASKPRAALPQMQKIARMEMEASSAAMKARQATDDDEKKKLSEEAADKAKKASTEVPKLLREAINENADHPNAMDAAVRFLRTAKQLKATSEEVKKAADIAVRNAAQFGPRFSGETSVNVIEMIPNTDDLKSVIIDLARKTEVDLGEKASPMKIERVLGAMMSALGNSPDAKAVGERLEKIAAKADAEYLAKQPKLDTTAFKGRKGDGSQVALMELFTGAQCPPCVAADIAFDQLPKIYQPNDVVLLQYHMHIPGPDPMTNPDTEARWAYYRKLNAEPEQKVRGVPSSLFNGKVEGGGGGGIPQAGAKLAQYRKLIDPLLDETRPTKVKVNAARSGDKITIAASVNDIEESSEKIKLRFALVEETVRYPGGNGMRLHHHVVRAMPGGADGIALAGKNESKQVTVDLTELRGQLTKYLDEFVAKKGPFPKPNRPMDFKHLKVVAWVQNDEDGTVIQAAQADVKEAAAGE